MRCLLPILLVPICACESRLQNLCSFGNRIDLRYEDVGRALQSRLTASGIEFQTNEQGEICFSQADEDDVLSLLFAVNSEVRGLDADYRVAGGEFGEAVLESLRIEGIQFDSRENADGILLYLEQPQDIGRVKEVVGDVASDMFDGANEAVETE